MFCRKRDVCQPQVCREDYDEEREMCPRLWINPREHNLKQAERGIEAMLRDIAPEGKGGGERGVEDGPVDDCHQERESGDCCVEEGVEGLERTREAV